MKIATFNINGINQRLDALVGWLAAKSPDVVCLQELKAEDTRFPLERIRDAGYGAIWQGQKSWNGVAILAKGVDPIETRRGLPGGDSDPQSRYIEAAVNGILVGCLYLPNGNPQPGPKFAYKLAWFERFIAYAALLLASKHPVALCGDYNVVPTDFDIYDTKSWKKNALLQPESRAAYARLLSQGWTDALRSAFPDERVYTFWDYFRNHWQKNSGLRIDHLLLSDSLANRLVSAGVDREVRDAARQRPCACLDRAERGRGREQAANATEARNGTQAYPRTKASGGAQARAVTRLHRRTAMWATEQSRRPH